MKHYNYFIAALTVAAFSTQVKAQDVQKASLQGDSIAIQLRLDQLEKSKVNLAKRIKGEDQKRNQMVPGISLENMEIINLQQDSLCLALRSEMTDINLEISEQREALKKIRESKPAPQTTTTAAPQTEPAPASPQKPNKIQQAVNALNKKNNNSNNK